MIVKALIEQLERLDPEATVRIGTYDGSEALFVLTSEPFKDTVWLETESNCDIKSELEDMYDACFYGSKYRPSPKMVEKYLYYTGITYKYMETFLGAEKTERIRGYVNSPEKE